MSQLTYDAMVILSMWKQLKLTPGWEAGEGGENEEKVDPAGSLRSPAGLDSYDEPRPSGSEELAKDTAP